MCWFLAFSLTHGNFVVYRACMDNHQTNLLLLSSDKFLISAVTRALESGKYNLVVSTKEYAALGSGPAVSIVDLGLCPPFCMNAIRELSAKVPVLAVTSKCAPEEVQAAIAAGAMGCLSTESDPDVLPGKLERIIAGEVSLDEFAAAAMFSVRPRASSPTGSPLSGREVEILRLAADGSNVALMARTLHVSPHTVRDMLRSCYKKLSVHDRAAAVASGFRMGYLR